MIRHFPWILMALQSGAAVLPAAGAEVSDADKRIVQTVQRLARFDYGKANPKTREAINRYLTATAGSEEYFGLVEKYGIREQVPVLLQLLADKPATASAAQSVKLLLAMEQGEALRQRVRETPPEKTGELLESIAGVGTAEAMELVMDSVKQQDVPLDGRLKAVKAMGLSAAGQKALLEAAREKSLPQDVGEAAGSVLAVSTDETVRKEAAGLFTMKAAAPLPPVAELAKREGDPDKGRVVFMTWCFSCHQVDGMGIDFGPALTEIGSKLAKEALYDSIINPGAGISFGYEGFEIKTKSGETFTGMIASATDTELALRLPGGVIQKMPPEEIVAKTPLGVSLMTPGLHTLIGEAPLVDLVTYLSGLVKKE